MDRLLDTYTIGEVIKKYFSLGRVGVDKYGCPRQFKRNKLYLFIYTQLSIINLIFFYFTLYTRLHLTSSVYVTAMGRMDIKGIRLQTISNIQLIFRLIGYIFSIYTGLLLSTRNKEFSDYCVYTEEKYVEAAREERERTGRPISMHTVIFDFEHLSMKQLTCKPGTIQSQFKQKLKKNKFINLSFT